MGCGVEMWERMAYYCVRAVLPLYIAQADDPGGLHFSQAQKGTIFAVWALVQSIVPMVSGGFADRYGYKRTIATSVTLACTGYILMANLRSYPGFFFGCLVLALGTAIFKPGIQGTLAQSMSKRNSSVGWGLFYWLVNVGAGIGPLVGTFMRTDELVVRLLQLGDVHGAELPDDLHLQGGGVGRGQEEERRRACSSTRSRTSSICGSRPSSCSSAASG